MVSGLVTSPEDHDRICLEDASPISMASKLLMSIKALAFVRSWSCLLGVVAHDVLRVGRDRVVGHAQVAGLDDLVRLVVLGEADGLGLLGLLGVLVVVGGRGRVSGVRALLVGHRV